jgi:hypothetical protein
LPTWIKLPGFGNVRIAAFVADKPNRSMSLLLAHPFPKFGIGHREFEEFVFIPELPKEFYFAHVGNPRRHYMFFSAQVLNKITSQITSTELHPVPKTPS